MKIESDVTSEKGMLRPAIRGRSHYINQFTVIMLVASLVVSTPALADDAYKLGQQIYITRNLASQYAIELHQARQEQPVISPKALQDSLKLKYFNQLEDVDPRIVVQYFINAVQKAESEDFEEWSSAYSAYYEQNLRDKAIFEVSKVINRERTAYHKGETTMEQLQITVAQQIDKVLKDKASNRPFRPIMDAIFSAVVSTSGMEDELSDKLAILEVMKRVHLPSGYDLLSDPTFFRKYQEANIKLKSDHFSRQTQIYEAKVAQQKVDTTIRINQMVSDTQNCKLRPLAYYLKPYESRTIDYFRVSRAWKHLKTTTKILHVNK